ncbi:MAG: hypothetical protein FVQ77_16705 [Cytophagales bacterium]|nr:hypothetical protein [Cytophagales bacterium]
MKTVIVNIPEKKESLLFNYFKKHRLKAHVVDDEADEELIAKWINQGLESGEVSEEVIFETLRKNGAKI